MKPYTNDLTCMDFCEVTDRIATGHDDGTVCVWHPATLALLYREALHDIGAIAMYIPVYYLCINDIGAPGFISPVSFVR